MELKDNPAFTDLFAQVQVLEMVCMAAIRAHPEPEKLLSEMEQQLGLLRSLSSTRATDLMGRIAHTKLDQKAQGWMDYARSVLPQD
ncbi:hypothetical protein ACODUN_14480 [Stenotrophomonas riyadhensis]